ncbi:MAG: hypothetical protein GWP59_05025 [Chlamydiales bacterium]|nr:hypothetical protein [Chlamydiales bacterium]NCF71047.1 hypothetical protein [Chlamydiales bacterium]
MKVSIEQGLELVSDLETYSSIFSCRRMKKKQKALSRQVKQVQRIRNHWKSAVKSSDHPVEIKRDLSERIKRLDSRIAALKAKKSAVKRELMIEVSGEAMTYALPSYSFIISPTTKAMVQINSYLTESSSAVDLVTETGISALKELALIAASSFYSNYLSFCF